jgi:hypothetical protein
MPAVPRFLLPSSLLESLYPVADGGAPAEGGPKQPQQRNGGSPAAPTTKTVAATKTLGPSPRPQQQQSTTNGASPALKSRTLSSRSLGGVEADGTPRSSRGAGRPSPSSIGQQPATSAASAASAARVSPAVVNRSCRQSAPAGYISNVNGSSSLPVSALRRQPEAMPVRSATPQRVVRDSRSELSVRAAEGYGPRHSSPPMALHTRTPVF